MNEALLIIAKLISNNFWTLYMTINFWIILAFLVTLGVIGVLKIHMENK